MIRPHRDVAWTLAVQVAAALLSLASAAVLARWLGPEGKGSVTLALLLPELLGLALSGGVDAANVYFAATRRFPASELAAVSLVAASAAAAVAFATMAGLVAAGALPLSFGLGWSTWSVAMLVLPPVLLGGQFAGILRGAGRIPLVGLARIVQGLFHLIFTCLFVGAWSGGVVGALWATLGGTLVGTTITALALRRVNGAWRLHWSRTTARSVLAYGLQGHLGNLCQFLNYRLDAFVVSHFLGAGSLGIYACAVRTAEVLLQVPSAIASVVFPAAAMQEARARQFTQRSLVAAFGVTLGGAILLGIAGPAVIELIYSSAFARAYPPLLALLPGMAFLAVTKVAAAEIAGRGYPQYNSVISAASAFVTLMLMLALVPRHGTVGAAAATSVSYALSAVATLCARAAAARGRTQRS